MTDPTTQDPIEKPGQAGSQQDVLLSHEYDGIREYDNPMPKWWVWIFWGSFYFAGAYFLHYHITGNGESVASGYEADLSAAREKEALAVMGTEVSEESLAKLQANEAMMADASKLFVQRCAQCHGAKGEGLIGPNLTDDYWIHGAPSLMNISDIISEGVQTKGMPPWKRQLRPIEIGKLAAYVGTMLDTNVPGKGPEGSKISTLAAPTGELGPAETTPTSATPANAPRVEEPVGEASPD